MLTKAKMREFVDMKPRISPNDAYQMMFVYMKLTGSIDWSWWLVMIPTYLTIWKCINFVRKNYVR